MATPRVTGSFVALITPMNDDYAIDMGGFRTLLDDVNLGLLRIASKWKARFELLVIVDGHIVIARNGAGMGLRGLARALVPLGWQSPMRAMTRRGG